MRRLWVRWALLVGFVVVLAVVFVNLGEWQLRRLAERETRNATTITNEQAPVQPYEQVFSRVITDADQWQRVSARGTFDGDHQFVARNRNNGDDRGYEVVTPLRTATGTVLVDRGFIATVPGTGIPAVGPAPPAGEVTVVGHVRRNEQGRSGAVTPVSGSIRLINSDALQPAIGYPIANGFISAIEVTPAQSGGFEPIELPELSSGPHFWYAMQWFMFAGIGIFGIVVFIRGDLRDRRAAKDRLVVPGSRHGSRTA
ncbi:MAG TPA: SURF1 family protein [Microlunatus sp.]|nr:SURF1 family protein [Microlunatus sp.]